MPINCGTPALLAVRQAGLDTRVAREALEAETQPLITDVPRGIFTEEMEWHSADGTTSQKRRDRSGVSVGIVGPEPIASVSVPVRNVGNGPARLEDVTFVTTEGNSAQGSVVNPVLPAGEMTNVELLAAPEDAAVAVAESIAGALEDFAVVVAYADASSHPREVVRVDVANGQHPRVTGRRWAKTRASLLSTPPSSP